ncbi:MAG: carbohydrate ABC transporter permease [Caldilinea sp.]|uniref:carbohydrate ABC transporter permease n=1 Tax=Caldilinea sp. TaxID=2293560 RepID=UPI002C075464|nr:carbohydrate ABC transporter permease [Caldilinea sp.]
MSGNAHRWQRWVVMVVLWGVAILFLIPFLWMLSSSLKPNYQIFEIPPRWIPNPPRWENYTEALTILPFDLYIRNTAVITLLTIAGHLASCTLIAYAFARLRAPGRDALFVVMLATMMLPYPVTMVPLYVLFNRLGWINTILPLTAPAFFGSPFYIFLMRQFFLTIPRDFEDAARIDGANTLQIIGRIMAPMALPALATVTIFTFQATWNDFLSPLIYLQRPELYTVTLGLQFFRSTYTTNWAYLMAASLVTTLPVIVVFFAAQRYFVEGITMTGVKG